jgi:hypothetical protein
MKLASAVLAAVVLAGTAGSLVAPGSSHAFSPLVYVAVKAGARLIGNNIHRRAEYTEITRNRDEDLAAVQTTQQVRDYQEERGWLDPAPYQQEQQRLEALSQGITDRARSRSHGMTTTRRWAIFPARLPRMRSQRSRAGARSCATSRRTWSGDRTPCPLRETPSPTPPGP